MSQHRDDEPVLAERPHGPPTPHDPAARLGRRPRRELIAWRNAIFAIFFLSGLSLASWVARLPAIRDDVGLSTQGVGLVILAGSAASVLGLIVAPWLMARFGARARHGRRARDRRRRPRPRRDRRLASLPSVPLVVIGLALFGFGNGAVDVMMNVEGAEAEREIGKTLMPLMHAFFSFGTVAGAGLAAAASALPFRSRSTSRSSPCSSPSP